MKENKILEMIAIDRSENNSPRIPGKRKNGKKTIIVVSDELKLDLNVCIEER